VASFDDSLLAQLKAVDTITKTAADRFILSRFMRLENFINNYLRTADVSPSDKDDAEHYLPKELSITLRRTHRRNILLKGHTYGHWYDGLFGSYRFHIGVYEKRVGWCHTILPFATFQSEIKRKYDRTGSPDEVLRQLGLTFREDEYWIEIQFKASIC